MRLRRNPKAKEIIYGSEMLIKDPSLLAGAWRRFFNLPPSAPLKLEIGMGRGRFIVDAAAAQQESAWLGLEFREEMIAYAMARLEGEIPANLRFLHENAQLLPAFFAPGEVNALYLHFPDPWPKMRHGKRRLTHGAFLALYRQILNPAGRLCFKTDNQEFFRWSEDSFTEEGWQILSRDENTPPHPLGLATEYENRYRRLGQPIFSLELAPPK